MEDDEAEEAEEMTLENLFDWIDTVMTRLVALQVRLAACEAALRQEGIAIPRVTLH